MKERLLVAVFMIFCNPLLPQQLYYLSATKNDPLFTTYAAPPERSDYKNDQGYRLHWDDPGTNLMFISKQGPDFGIAFKRGNDVLMDLERYAAEPVINVSFSDMCSLVYYPFRDLRCEIFFDVYSSSSCFAEVTLRNEGSSDVETDVCPYFTVITEDSVKTIENHKALNGWSVPFVKPRDGWMKEHNIPVEENLRAIFASDLHFDSIITFSGNNTDKRSLAGNITGQAKIIHNRKGFVTGMTGIRHFIFNSRDEIRFRIVLLVKPEKSIPDAPEINSLLRLDPKQMIAETEKIYSAIPPTSLSSSDINYFYLSCFSLMRQCMMKAEGECHHNYYVFSREPRWGWGYGGQVFHESLSMLAYAYMDPQGAMNSQRVFMERQRPDGFINYRTGPYLNEDIPYDSTFTSSAPWFNYINYEIYRITGDKAFLKDAYESGSRFYKFYVASRDSNNNGLCEWGGEASLESVRDARVAVWDNVGWPSNFEGPDVNSMLVREARSLEEMAKILGKDKEAAQWSSDAVRRSDKVNWFMWDDSDGFYYNINRNDQSFTYHNKDDLKIREIIGFLPYWAGISTPDQDVRLIANLKDPSQFWRPFGVPSLSASDGYYNGIGYWNGPVWVQWDYLIFRGLLEHGDTTGARILAGKVLDNMIWHLKKDHTFWEFYSPDKREAGWNQTYIWAGIAARFIIDLE